MVGHPSLFTLTKWHYGNEMPLRAPLKIHFGCERLFFRYGVLMANINHMGFLRRTGCIVSRITVSLGVMAITFAGCAVGAETASTEPPAKSLATPTRETAKINMSQAAWWDGANQWLQSNLLKPGFVPFSFVYDGKNSTEFLANWDFTATKKQLPDTGTQHTLTYLDKKTGLEVRCEAVVFKNHPAVEWVLKFKNTEDRTTPIISDIQALDTTLTDKNNDYTLHHALGVGEGIDARKETFRPISRPLPADSQLKMSPLHGRPSWGEFLPFFNIEMSNRGVMVGIGWTGQWLANFTRNAHSLNIRVGMELTHLKLYPGEEIRTPRILLLFWQGHRMYGQNLFRRIVLEHYYPQRDGKPLTMPFLCGSAALYHESFGATEQNQIDFASKFAPLGVEYLWMDVGWHETGKVTHIGPIDRKRFPNGLRAISDTLKKMDMGLLAWFAPEVHGGDAWTEQELPEMFLKLKDPDDKTPLFNFADKDALALITDHISTMVRQQGLSIFRLDGPYGANFRHKQPLQWWRDADKPDRQGITEIRYIEGLYWFWDEIVRRNPGLIIDLCGGGATRLDLEAVSRCVYLWRSDYDHPGFEPNGYQSHTYGISLWIPSTGIGSGYPDTYSFRSSINNGIAIAWNPYQPEITQKWPLAFPIKQKEPYKLKTVTRKTVGDVEKVGYEATEPFPWDKARRLTTEFKRIRHLFYGDFYPLTPYSVANNVWIAYQCHREDMREGMVLAFRRPECVTGKVNPKLWGLSPAARYEVHFEDNGVKRTFTGKELAEGLDVTIEDQPGSLLITYHQLP